jgi:hypothetical protein
MVSNFLPSCYCAPLWTSHVCRVDSTRSFRIGPLLFTGLAGQKNCLHGRGAHKEEWTSRGKNPRSTTATVTSFAAASPLLSCFSNSFCNTPATSGLTVVTNGIRADPRSFTGTYESVEKYTVAYGSGTWLRTHDAWVL